MSFIEVESLLQYSLLKIIKNFDSYSDDLMRLPRNLKSRLFNIMSKRGLVSDGNIDVLLSEDTNCIDLSHSDVTDVALNVIANRCPYLIKLDLNSLKQTRLGITSEGLSSIARHCKRLQVLYLRRCIEVCDIGLLDIVVACKNLRELNLGGCTLITDTTLEAIGEHCNQLLSINLSKTNITDTGINRMVSGPCSQSLKEIHIDNNHYLTDDSISTILHLCPRLSIFVFHNCPNITEQSRLDLENLHLNQKMQMTFTVY